MRCLHYKETRVVVNKLVNKFYNRFLFKIDSLSQDVVFPLDVSAASFNNLIPYIKDFLIT